MNSRQFPVRLFIGSFVIFILALHAIAAEPGKENAEYEAISRRIIVRVIELKKTYPVLESVREPEITDQGLAELEFEHGVKWALEDPSKPHSKGNARYEIFDKDGFWFRLLFYRGRWGGAAMFYPVEFGDLKLWFTYGYRPVTTPSSYIRSPRLSTKRRKHSKPGHPHRHKIRNA